MCKIKINLGMCFDCFVGEWKEGGDEVSNEEGCTAGSLVQWGGVGGGCAWSQGNQKLDVT